MSDSVLHLDRHNFETEISRAKGVALVDFWATWCGPCRQLEPVVEDLARRFAGVAKVAKLDIDGNQELAMRYGVRAVPTMLLFRDGEVVDRLIGVQPRSVLESRLEALTADVRVA